MKDACILIDLIQLDLLQLFFTLDFKLYTTESVINEIKDVEQAEIVSLAVKQNDIIEMPDGELFEVLVYQRTYHGISYQDATVLELAKRIEGTLLSADGLLRKAGIKEKIQVHGTLWVIYTLYETEMIDKEKAIHKINYLLTINSRISSELCKKMIKKIEDNQ